MPRLVLARILLPDAPGVYLFYCDDQWTVLTDTLHADLQQAQAQAEHEYDGIDSCWVYLPPPVEDEDPRRQTHRTIFQFDTPALDFTNYTAAEEAFERFRKTVPSGVRIAVDFGGVNYVNEFWPVLPMDAPTSRVKGHFVVCMRLGASVKYVFSILGLSNVPGYEHVGEGVCPACRGPFDHENSTCAKCGRFEIERFTWHPKK